MKIDDHETAKKILDAALRLWSEKGYADSSMRELARRTGMGLGALYACFRTKEEVVHYLYATLNAQARARYRGEDLSGADTGARFRRFLEIKLELLAPHRGCLPAILKEAVDPDSPLSPLSRDSSEVSRDSLELFREMLGAGEPAEVDPRLVGLRPPGALPLLARSARSIDLRARLLWVAHLALLLCWLHDRSPGARNTHALLEKLAGASEMLPMAMALPGATEVLRILDELLRPASPATPAPLSAEQDAAAAREVDVVVIGGGPIGILYATFLKKARPATKVLVLEKAGEPGHKIGESTLSGFVKAMQTVGIRKEVMRTLFHPKNGLGFLHVDEKTAALTDAPEYVLETFDETFQVERRVLDSLLIANARRSGVQVIQGARFDFKRSRLSAAEDLVVWQVGPRTFRARARLLVDASGPASVLAHELGMRTDEGVPFQSSSVWTYFAGVTPLASHGAWRGRTQFPRDEYTQHLCFKEGWLWYIPIASFQGAPTANLAPALDALLRGSDIPTRKDLCDELGLPMQPIVSIGLSLRSDRDDSIKEDPRGALERYRRKYPAIGKLLDGARVLEDHYGRGQTFMSRVHYRGHARQMAGDGWMLIGDAAFFVDPLISPGLTGGTATAWHAARTTIQALDAGVFTREMLADYEAKAKRLHEALERDNELVYMSFNHPEGIALVQRLQEVDARRHFLANAGREYGDEDTNVWGILDPEYQAIQREAWTTLREEEERVGREVPIAEQTPQDYEPAVRRLRALLGRYVDAHKELTPYVAQNETGRMSCA